MGMKKARTCHKELCKTLMLRMMTVNKFEETAFWLFWQ